MTDEVEVWLDADFLDCEPSALDARHRGRAASSKRL